MKKSFTVVAILAMALQCSIGPVFAAPPGGGGRPAGGGGRPAGGAQRAPQRPAGQQQRPSAPQRPQGGNRQGFDLGRDAKPAKPPSNGNANKGNANKGNANKGNANKGNANKGNGNNVNNGNRNNGNRTNVNTGNRNNVNVSGNTINRTVINNPVYVSSPAWGWNRGVAWAPAPYYWGGGFWGAMAIGVTSAAVYGAIVSNNVRYTSYQVQPSSPGATLLSNYHLTQTQCGPPNLVIVYGPNNSVICAYPNNLVSAGYYNLDTSTLSLTEAG